jgi:Holliday junction resolvase RusA-like endonuclease
MIVIPGIPVARARARAFSIGNKVRHYDSQKKEFERIVEHMKFLIVNEDFEKILNSHSYELEIVFYMPIPTCTPKKMMYQMSFESVPHVKKPDLDNLVKMYLDCANGILIHDDRKIYSIKAKKVYSTFPRTEMTIHVTS